jgi:heme-degrading monooxygenase HmoA
LEGALNNKVRRILVITVLEAPVLPEKTAQLENAFNQAIKQLDTGIVQSFLTRNSKEPAMWKILTIWENREALDAMRQSGEIPRVY